VVKTESERAQRDHLFTILQNVAAKLMRGANLPPLPRQVSEERQSRQVPTEALTYYSRAILYQDRGQKDRAIEMYNRALAVFPEYTEAKEGLQRVERS
jgi:tetratricopeptide (TPR) repeat protein